MNKTFLGLGTLTLTLAATTNAAPVNSGFETGDFTGWTVSNPLGTSWMPPFQQPAGQAAIQSSWGPRSGMSSPILSVEGNSFASLGTLDAGFFTGGVTYDISLTQSISLNQGDTISGWSLFYNGDNAPQDSAWVKILDQSGNLISNPWLAVSGYYPAGTPDSTPHLSASSWNYWSWQAPAADTYQLKLGVTTFGDNNFASYGFFDDIGVSSAQNLRTVYAMPEPSATSLLGLGFLGLVNRWRKSRKS